MDIKMLRDAAVHHFENLIELLKKEPYNLDTALKFFRKLLQNPSLSLTKHENRLYGFLQASLLNENQTIRNLTSCALNIAILGIDSQNGSYLYDAIVRSKKAKVHTGDPTNWQSLCSVLQYSGITELELYCVSSGQPIPLEFWKGLCSAIQSSSIRSIVYQDDRGFGRLDLARWQILSSSIKRSKLESLFLDRIRLSEIDVASLQALCSSIRESNLSQFDLLGCSLGELSSEQWRALCIAFQSPNLRALDLGMNNLDQLNNDSWEILWSAIQQSNITWLNLGGCLRNLPVPHWQRLCSALQGSRIITLVLNDNNFAEFDAISWGALCSAIQNSSINKIYLGHNNLERMAAANWQVLFKLIKSKITALSLGSNSLYLIEDVQTWQDLCSTFYDSNLKWLTLGSNSLGDLDDERWRTLWLAIQKSKLTKIDFSWNSIDDLDEIPKNLLISAIKDNFHLTEVELTSSWNQDLPPLLSNDLTPILNRNKKLHSIILEGKSVLLAEFKISDLAIKGVIEKILDVLHGLEAEKSEKARSICDELNTLLDEIRWKYANYLRDNDRFDEAIKIWLSIAPTSRHYEESHFEALQMVYHSSRNSNTVIVAFTDALPLCLDDEGSLIIWKDTRMQHFFDGLLLEAAGEPKGSMGTNRLADKERLSLLKWVMLNMCKDIKTETYSDAIPRTNLFATERVEGLKNLLQKKLTSTRHSMSDSDLDSLWDLTLEKIRIVPFKEKENLIMLINAISSLSATRLPTPKG